MRNKNLFLYIFVLLLPLSIIILSFRDSLHSETDTSAIILESNPCGIAINTVTNIAVVVTEKADSVSIVDLNTQTVLSTINVGSAPRGVAIDKGLNIAVIGNSHDNTVSVIDLNTYQLIATITVGNEPEGIAIDSSTHRACVTNHRDGTISVIDLMNLSSIITILAGQEPKDVAIDPELNLALAVNEKDYTVSVIDLSRYRITGIIGVEQKPQAIDINPEMHFAVVVNENDNSITIIDLQIWQTSTIQTGKHPLDIAINPLDNRALVICDEDRSLLLIDLNTDTIIREYDLNKLPKGIAVNNFTNIAAITDDKTDSLTLIQLPNPVPEITSIIPDNALRQSNEVTVNIEGNKFIRSSVVNFNGQPLTTIFTNNHEIRATIPKEMLSEAGTFPITISNPAPEGGTSNSIDFTVDNPVPSISAIEPADAMAGTQGITLNIYGTGLLDDTEVHFNGLRKLTKYISNTNLQMDLTSEDLGTPGQYEIVAYNSPPGGGNSNKVIFTIRSPFEIEITSPSGGETINKESVMVKGTIKSNTGDIGITVNGIVAEIMGNEWIANDVPLTVGENTITAVATDSYGNTDTKTITVYSNDVTQTVKLSANITSGIPPLTTYFSASTSFIPVSYQMDFDGDGVIDYSETTFEDINYTYTTEGIFYPTLTVIDDQGNTYSDTIAITLLNKTEIDTLLKRKWEGMKGALQAQKVDAAANYFAQETRTLYTGLFNNLYSSLPQIAQEMQGIQLVSVIGNTAKYRIRRSELYGGQIVNMTYNIYFIIDSDGLWKLYRY